PDRRAGQAEILPQAVDDVALVRLGQGIGAGGEEDEAGGAGFRLRHVTQLQTTARYRRGRMVFGHGRQPAVELGGADLDVPDALDVEDRLHQPVDVAALKPRQGDQWDAAKLGQQALALFAQFEDLGVLVLDQIPFVDG